MKILPLSQPVTSVILRAVLAVQMLTRVGLIYEGSQGPRAQHKLDIPA